MEFRKSHGEEISHKSWMLRDNFDLSGKNTASLPRPLKNAGLKSLMNRVLIAQGIRKPLENGEKRHEIHVMNGLR